MANVYDTLLERGYIKQLTHEEEMKKILEKEKVTFLAKRYWNISTAI